MSASTWIWIALIAFLVFCCGPMLFMGRRHSKDSDHKNKELNMKTEQNEPATTYTCPMHPEVQKDKPGKCPKCGMQLAPKK